MAVAALGSTPQLTGLVWASVGLVARADATAGIATPQLAVAGLAADAAALGSPPALGVLWLKRCDERRLA